MVRIKAVKDRLQRSLLAWYERNQRQLPWRQTTDPYRILVVEYMSQQTPVERVLPYYEEFLRVFPDINALARARLGQVLKVWEGLGYYARARHLLAAARQIVRDAGGVIPSTYEELRKLPGCGPYTAAAIASIAFNQPVAVVDGNVVRLLCRVFGLWDDPRREATKQRLRALAGQLMPRSQARAFNEALMELGSLICTPRAPRCDVCCWDFACQARQLSSPTLLPVKSSRQRPPHHNIAIGVIWKDGKVLIAQRHPKGLLGGLWEFPGGKREPGETLRHCCAREIREEVGLTVRVGRKWKTIRHAYSHLRVTLHVFECTYEGGEPKPLGCQRVRWVRPDELSRYAFPAANKVLLDELRLRFAPSGRDSLQGTCAHARHKR